MKSFMKIRIAPLLAALAAGTCVLVAAPEEARAVGSADGRVTGTVIEATSQAPVPGALVTLKGGSGVNKRVQTQEDGTYEIPAVPPGTYDMVFSYEGLKPLKRRVVVNPDAATPVNIMWTAEQEKEETTVIEEERHLTNPDSSATGTIMSVNNLNKTPIARSYQSVSAQVPGVTVGGGNPNVKGGKTNNNRYLVNGLDLTDPVTNTFSANFQQDSLETVQVTTGGFEAKYNALGAIIAVQTRRGTNNFHGAVSAYWAPSFLVDYDTFGPQTFDGSKPFDYSKEKPEQGRYELNLSAQGPIIKDRLFFNAGIQYNRSLAVTPSGPPRFVQVPSRLFESFYLLGGLTFVPADTHRIHVEAFGDPTTIDYENNNASGANASTPYSQAGRFQGGNRATIEWAWQASKRVTTKVLLGYNQNKLDVGPQGIRGIADGDLINGVPYSFGRTPHVNQDDSTVWFNTGGHSVTNRRRIQLDASVTATGEAAGRHEAEFGVQTAFVEQSLRVSQTGGTSGQDDSTGYGISYTDRNGGLLDRGLCDLDPQINPGALTGNYTGNGCFRRSMSRSYALHNRGTTFGTYIQDRYKPKKWLTILPGTRFDVGTMTATDSNVAQSAAGFGPRLSVIADVTNDSKTIVQVSYGRTTEMPSLRGVSGYDGARRAGGVIEQYSATTRRFEFLQRTGGADGSRLSFEKSPAVADEILLSLRRELAKGVLVRADYTYRYLHNQYETMEVNAIWDPTGTRVVGFNNGIPIRTTLTGFNPAATSRYSGLDLILETKFTDLELQGSYTLSQSWGTAGNIDGGAFDNPRFGPFYNSYQSGIDTRHQLKSIASYNIWQGFTLGFILNWRSGVALTKAYTANEPGYTIRRAPTGYEPGAYPNTGTANPGQLGTYSDVRSWTTFRSPDIFTLNVMLTYDFEKLLKQHLSMNVQINNVFALQNAVGVNGTEGSPTASQFGLATNRQDFRTLTLGVRYDF
ncbi:MAG: TonB-dependent receptor [Labilithrix sp.]|nr:TonB-dependent receptor [Labilithrix sp.]MCW5813979.1 TonB-dependent receptor [Labilithrix sp.]